MEPGGGAGGVGLSPLNFFLEGLDMFRLQHLWKKGEYWGVIGVFRPLCSVVRVCVGEGYWSFWSLCVLREPQGLGVSETGVFY